MNYNITLEKENNEYFKDWIYKIWHHHDTIDKLYQCNYETEIKFEKNEVYYKILNNNKEHHGQIKVQKNACLEVMFFFVYNQNNKRTTEL